MNLYFSMFIKLVKTSLLNSFRQWILLILLCFTLSTAFFMYKYLDDYYQGVIDEIQILYPKNFIRTRGQMIKPWSQDFSHREEVFYLNTELIFRFDSKDKKRALPNVTLRSFHDNSPMVKSYNISDKSRVYLSSGLFTTLENCPLFKNGNLILMSGGFELKIPVEKIDFADNENWLIAHEDVFHTLNIAGNIINIISKKITDYSGVKKKYLEAGIKSETWEDRLPFFFRVFFKISNKIYLVFVASFLILVSILIYSVMLETIRDFRKYIVFSNFYNVPRLFQYRAYLGLTVSYAFVIFLISNIILFFVKKLFVNMEINTFLSLKFLAVILIICFFCTTSFLEFLWNKANKR